MDVNKNETKIIKNKEEEKINPLKFQLNVKVNLNNLLDSDILNDAGRLLSIHQLSNKNLGILLGGKLIIISHISYKTIKIIEPNYKERNTIHNSFGNKFIDFKELKNSDIIIWSSNIILIYNKEFNLIQRIDEVEYRDKCKRKDYDYDISIYYEINSVREIKKGKFKN